MTFFSNNTTFIDDRVRIRFSWINVRAVDQCIHVCINSIFPVTNSEIEQKLITKQGREQGAGTTQISGHESDETQVSCIQSCIIGWLWIVYNKVNELKKLFLSFRNKESKLKRNSQSASSFECMKREFPIPMFKLSIKGAFIMSCCEKTEIQREILFCCVSLGSLVQMVFCCTCYGPVFGVV